MISIKPAATSYSIAKAIFSSRIAAKIRLTGRGSLVDADALFQQYFRTGVTPRVLGYSNPKLDEILDLEQQTFDSKKREKLLQEAHRIILDDAPAIPLWNAMDIYAHRADLIWTAPPDEKVQLKQASFKTK